MGWRQRSGRFAVMIRLEAARMAQKGVIPERDHTLTSIALVGAINGLIGTWTADEQWSARVDQVVDEAARMIVVALSGG